MDPASLENGHFSRRTRGGVLGLRIRAKWALRMYRRINNCRVRDMNLMKYTHAFLRILSLNSPSLDVASSAIASRSPVWQASSMALVFSSSRSALETDLKIGSAAGLLSSPSSLREFGTSICSSSIVGSISAGTLGAAGQKARVLERWWL